MSVVESDHDFRCRIILDEHSLKLDQWVIWLASGTELDNIGRKIGIHRKWYNDSNSKGKTND